MFGWLGSKLSLAGHDLAALPGQIYHLTLDALPSLENIEHPLRFDSAQAGRAWGEFLTHPIREVQDTAAGKFGKADQRAAQDLYGAVAGTEQTLEHPGRDPFATLLTLSPLGHGLMRGGELARGVDITAPRTLKMGGAVIPLPPASGSAAIRAGQRLYGSVLQHALDTNPEGRLAAHAAGRIGGSIAETSRYQARMRTVPVQLLARAGRELRGSVGKRVPGLGDATAAQAALRLTSENSMPAEAAAFHRAQAEAGVEPAANLKLAGLYDRIDKAGMLRQDEHGNVGVAAEKFPKLAAADAALARAQADAERIVGQHGLMSDTGQQARIDAPARIRAGAVYENPTPAKLGVASPTLAAARAELERVAPLRERALARDAQWLHETKNRDLGPLSPEAAQARLAKLDAIYERIVQRTIPHVSPYGGKLSQAEQLDRNFLNSRAGKGKYRGMSKSQTVKQEEWNLADAKIRDLAEKGTTPASRQMADLIRERDALRRALDERSLALLGGDHPAPLPSAPAYAHGIPMPSNPHTNLVNFLGNRLEEMQARVARLEQAAAKRVKPTGIVGGETARPGRGYVPYKLTEAKAARSDIARQVGPVVPKTRSPIGAHEFTGEALRQGLVPDATTALVARHLQRLYRFVNTDEFRRAVLKTGSKLKRSSREILVRDPDVPAAAHFSLEIEHDLGRKHVTLDELAQLEGHRQALANQMASMVKGGFNADAALQKDRLAPAMAEARRYGIGAEAPKGFLWVDRNVFGDLGNAFAFSRGRVGKLGDAINSAVTTATVYLKPGHFPQRVLTNAGAAFLQGALKPGDLGASVRVWRQLSHEDRIRALGAAGQGGYESMPHDSEGLVGEAATRGAMWWAKHVDAPFRFASIAYEARKAGYTGAPAFRRFLHVLEQPDRFPKEEALRADAAAKEANRAAIAYDRMSDAERRTLGRVAWFYPWVRSATLYAGRALTNHPYKASMFAQVGVEGRKQQQSALGDLPSFEYGLTPLGGNRVSDLQRLFPFSTAADLLQVPAHPEALVGNANPAVSGLLGLVANLDGFGKQQHGSRLNTALDNVLSSIPETQIVKAYLGRNQPQGNRMFPNSGRWAGTEDALLRALLGAEYPRTINPAAAHSAAARERSGR